MLLAILVADIEWTRFYVQERMDETEAFLFSSSHNDRRKLIQDTVRSPHGTSYSLSDIFTAV